MASAIEDGPSRGVFCLRCLLVAWAKQHSALGEQRWGNGSSASQHWGCFCGESVRSSSLEAMDGISEGSSCAEQCWMHAVVQGMALQPEQQREGRALCPCGVHLWVQV